MAREPKSDRPSPPPETDWKELRDHVTNTNYYNDGRMIPGYTEPKFTVLGWILLVLGLFSLPVQILLAPYGTPAEAGWWPFLVWNLAGFAFSILLVVGGLRMVKPKWLSRLVTRRPASAGAPLAAARPKRDAAVAEGGSAPRVAEGSATLRGLAALLVVFYFLPSHTYIGVFGISPSGLTMDVYHAPLHLPGTPIAALLLVLPVVALLFCGWDPLVRFQYVAAAAIALLDAGALLAVQDALDRLALGSLAPTHAYGFTLTLVLDALLFAAALGLGLRRAVRDRREARG
jgi:hypothetical protein